MGNAATLESIKLKTLFSHVTVAKQPKLALAQRRSQCILGSFGGTKLIYGDRRQICERVEVSTIKFQLFKRPKMKYLLFTVNI
jgi:hypothetical protein